MKSSDTRCHRLVGLLALFSAFAVSCGGADTAEQPTTSSVIGTDQAMSTTTSTALAPTTSPPSTDPAGIPLRDIVELTSLSIHIDPLAMDLIQTQKIVDLLADIISENPLTSPAVAILYATGEESTQWAMETTRELDCRHFTDPSMYNVVGWGGDCGFLMRVDAMKTVCDQATMCKNGLTVAAHEFFHVIGDQAIEPCICEPLIFGNRLPNWLNEGLADYFGYSTIYGADPDWIDKILADLRDRAFMPQVNAGLIDMERLWAEGFGEPWFQFLYDRSFFAVVLLVQQFDETTVFDVFLDNVVATGHFSSGFEATFGKTEAQFNDEFEDWLTTV